MIFRGKLAVTFREGNSQIKYSVFSPAVLVVQKVHWWFGAWWFGFRLDPQK